MALGRDLAVADARWSASRAHGTLTGPLLEDPLELALALPGRHQFDNAALAVMAYVAFSEWWLPMTGHALAAVEDVVHSLATVDWPLRAEIVQEAPLLLVDAAHNPSGMAALAAMLGEHGRGWQVMLAVRKDRDAAELIRTLAPWTACFWLARCQGETLRPADELAVLVDRVAPACLVAVGSPQRCLTQALREADRGPGVVVTGSQHALGEWLQAGVLRSPRLERRLSRHHHVP